VKKDSDSNRENLKEVWKLCLENPTFRVIAWIDSDEISDDYAWYEGSILHPAILSIAWSDANKCNVCREYDAYEDCYAYYGDDADDWPADELEKKAAEIPWEEVIAVRVSAC